VDREAIRITVYGFVLQKAAVGDGVSHAGLYIQHPFGGEYDSTVSYPNPHFFFRPGASMPEPENLALGPYHHGTNRLANKGLTVVGKS
jgi:hypothetical protein